jgi:hypothetical protein
MGDVKKKKTSHEFIQLAERGDQTRARRTRIFVKKTMFIIFTMNSSKQWNMKSSGMKCK